jgi:carbamoyl-phosphate synthase large subunit
LSLPPRRDEVNLLFTSAGRRVELLRAFRQAYLDLDLTGRIVAVDRDPLAPALQVADRAYLLPSLDDPAYLPELAQLIRRENIRRVFPLIDPDVPVLAQGRAQLEEQGACVVVVPEEAAEIARDKLRTFRFFCDHGIPTPKTWLPGETPWGEIRYPVFLKPRYGSAGKDSFRAQDREEAEFYSRHIPDPIVQEYLSGAEITNDVSCGLDGQVWAVVSRKRIEVRWGEVAKGQTVRDRVILGHCLTVTRELRAQGPITIQCILHGGEPRFTEINARFGGGLPLGIAAGVPSPRWYLAEAAGLPVQPPPLGEYRQGLFLTRFDESFFIDETRYQELASHRLRPG